MTVNKLSADLTHRVKAPGVKEGTDGSFKPEQLESISIQRFTDLHLNQDAEPDTTLTSLQRKLSCSSASFMNDKSLKYV